MHFHRSSSFRLRIGVSAAECECIKHQTMRHLAETKQTERRISATATTNNNNNRNQNTFRRLRSIHTLAQAHAVTHTHTNATHMDRMSYVNCVAVDIQQ